MARIYLVLAGFAISLLIANFGVGIWVGDLNGVADRVQLGAQQYKVARGNGAQGAIDDARESMLAVSAELAPIKKRHGIHFLLGVLSALVCVLVNGIAMTYFIGSSKWCSEVVDTYSLDLSYIRKSRTLKRRAYPWTISGVAVIVVIVAFGAASDPATQIESSASWVTPHMIVAILGTMWLLVSFLNQAGLIGAHYDVINEIVEAVKVRRAEIGQADSLGDGATRGATDANGLNATMGGDINARSLGDQSTFGDAHVDDVLFDDGMKLEDLSERYTEEGVLGKGGMGEVILATDTRLGRKVAIKRILGKAARSKSAVQRFLTEAKSMAELSHPNIVQIYDYGRATDGPFLIMECVQGGSLLEKCKAGPIELDEAVNIFGQLCDGLAKAHAAAIIHRDIKPANVLMSEDGVPKLTDFGLAKDDTADTGMTMEGAVIGTLDFMPPEQRQAAELTDHRSDLWSLAATFYQMLTGKSPKVINIASLPPELQSVVAKALEESKEERFQSALEMKEAVQQAVTANDS